MDLKKTIWLAPVAGFEKRPFFIRGVGFRERMKPATIRRACCHEAIIMHFHSKALCGSSPEDCEEVENAFVVWPSGSPQFYGDEAAEWEHSWLVFTGALESETLEKEGLPLNKPARVNAAECFDKHILPLYEEMKSHMKQDDLDVELRMKLFLHELGRVWKGEPRKTPACLAETAAFMEAHLDRKLSLEDLARKASLSPPRFCALFKSCFGEPPMKRLNALRMRRAAQLLSAGDATVKEVAEEAGFSDQLHFSRNFKAYYKLSPREFAKSVLSDRPA